MGCKSGEGGAVGWRVQVQVVGGDTFMILHKVLGNSLYIQLCCLFECYFSNFYNACLLPFEFIMIRNEFSAPSCSLTTPLGGLEASFSFLGPLVSMMKTPFKGFRSVPRVPK